MTLTSVIPDLAWIVDDFLSAEHCLQLIERTEKVGYAAAPIGTVSIDETPASAAY